MILRRLMKIMILRRVPNDAEGGGFDDNLAVEGNNGENLEGDNDAEEGGFDDNDAQDDDDAQEGDNDTQESIK